MPTPQVKGQKVVVKVQRPGLKELFDIDLKNVRVLAQLLQKVRALGGASGVCPVRLKNMRGLAQLLQKVRQKGLGCWAVDADSGRSGVRLSCRSAKLAIGSCTPALHATPERLHQRHPTHCSLPRFLHVDPKSDGAARDWVAISPD